MPKGNPGLPKTKAQREKIAEGVRRYHQLARSSIDVVLAVDEADDDAVRRLASAMRLTMSAYADTVTMLKGRIAQLEEALVAHGVSDEPDNPVSDPLAVLRLTRGFAGGNGFRPA